MNKIITVAQNFDIYDGDGLNPFARTGATSLDHIYSAGAEGVILGHSEVEDDIETVNKKLLTIAQSDQFKQGNAPHLTILIGESWEEFEQNSIQEVAEIIREKCEILFNGVPHDLLGNLILGYEPKWGSRGSGRDDMLPPQPDLISECVSAMENFIIQEYGDLPNLLFVYGGRSTPERTLEILTDENIDGLILGSACNSIEKTLGIVNSLQEACGERKKVLICNFKAYNLENLYEEYVKELEKLDKSFVVVFSPPYTHINMVRNLTS